MQAEMTAEAQQELARIWWVLLLRGIAMIMLGALALGSPAMTAVVYVNVMAIFMMVEGIFRIVAGFTGGDGSAPRWLYFLGGFLQVVLSLWILGAPLLATALSLMIVYYMLAFSAIIGGVIDIVIALRDKAGFWPILGGIITILLGVWLFSFTNSEELGGTLFAFRTLIQVFGIFAIIGGIFNIVISLQFRRLKA